MFHFGWRERDRDDRRGYFDCPVCLTRKRAAEGARVADFTIFFLPVCPISEQFRYYRCDGCQEYFDPDDGTRYGFGDDPAASRWECRRCGAFNVSADGHCRDCHGRRLPWQ